MRCQVSYYIELRTAAIHFTLHTQFLWYWWSTSIHIQPSNCIACPLLFLLQNVQLIWRWRFPSPEYQIHQIQKCTVPRYTLPKYQIQHRKYKMGHPEYSNNLTSAGAGSSFPPSGSHFGILNPEINALKVNLWKKKQIMMIKIVNCLISIILSIAIDNE